MFCQSILLQAKDVCLDIVMLRKQQQISAERLRNVGELPAMCTKRLQVGDANVIETNKINLELPNAKTEASLNEIALRDKIQELTTLDESIPIVFGDSGYPAAIFPTNYEELRTEVLTSDYTLQALDSEGAAACKQITANKSQWLSKLELGCRRNTESSESLNGVVVGFLFPLFESHSKVKIAKAQSPNTGLQWANTSMQVESELTQLYREAHTLRTPMEEYEKTFQVQQGLSPLKQALTGG